MAHRPTKPLAAAAQFAIGGLPLAPLTATLTALIRSAAHRHPGLLERLGEHTEKRFGLQVTGAPLAFVLTPRRQAPAVTAVRRLPRMIDARITGRLPHLLGLMDGVYDGDALFFSRDLVIEGDVEAVLALRNALDDARLDLPAEAAALLPSLGWPVERFSRLALSLVRRRGTAWN